MKMAIVAPWYVANGGAEKVDGVLGEMYPDADCFALFYKDQGIPAKLIGRPIKTSFLHDIPGIQELYRPLLHLFPYAVESLDLREYDLVLTSEWACVKGVLLAPHTLHVSYCHTPMRHIWDLYRSYLADARAWQRPVYAWTAGRLRQFDFQAAQRVHHFVANSRYIQQRIETYYRRTSEVIYPPVDTSSAYLSEQHDDYYLSVGRLNRTKRLDLVVQACNTLGRRLVVSGWGPEEKALKAIAGPTIEFVGRVPDKELPALYANCRALIFAADEDFGIVPVEAQSYGRPVIAYGHGGSLETVRVDDPEGATDTGVFFQQQTVASLVGAIIKFEAVEDTFAPQDIQEHARIFDSAAFERNMRSYLERIYHERRLNR